MAAVPQIPKIIHFTLGGTDYSDDVINAKLTPAPGAVQKVITLDGTVHQDTEPVSWSLDLECVQDWSSTRPGLAYYLNDNAGDQVAFVLNVHAAGTATGHATLPPASGTLVLVPIGYGGDGNVFSTSTVSLPLIGSPTFDITP
jgi:hypothetical protein